MSKLTPEDFKTIESLVKQGAEISHRAKTKRGLSYTAIGERFGVSKGTIQKIAQGIRKAPPLITCMVCDDEVMRPKPNQKTCGSLYCYEAMQRASKVIDPEASLKISRDFLREERFMNRQWNKVFRGLTA